MGGALTLQRRRKTSSARGQCTQQQEDKWLTFARMSSSAIAWATPIPSLGDVPRPTSSIKTSESAVVRPKRAVMRLKM